MQKPNVPRPEEDTERVGLIQGLEPQSRNEWNLAKALEEFKLPYIYQVIVVGGGWVRGTIILDFLVYTPFATPVPLYGEYWHSGQRRMEDILQEAIIADYYKRQPVPIYGSETETVEAAREAVRLKLL